MFGEFCLEKLWLIQYYSEKDFHNNEKGLNALISQVLGSNNLGEYYVRIVHSPLDLVNEALIIVA